MLTTRAQRFWMFCIGFCAFLLGIVVIVPFKSVFEHENLFLIEALCKLIFVPILVILLSIYPNRLKYSQVKGYREQSRIVSVVSYLPVFVYLAAMISQSIYLLAQGYVLNGAAPMGLVSWNLWFIALIVALILIIVAFHIFPKYEMQLNVSEHVVLDVCVFVVTICFGFMLYLILKATDHIFAEVGNVGNPYLLVYYIFALVGLGIELGHLKNLIARDEVNVNIRMNDLDAKSFVARVAEYNRAYNDVMDNFENYFSEDGSLSITVEPDENQPAEEHVEVAEQPVEETVEETAQPEEQVEVVEQIEYVEVVKQSEELQQLLVSLEEKEAKAKELEAEVEQLKQEKEAKEAAAEEARKAAEEEAAAEEAAKHAQAQELEAEIEQLRQEKEAKEEAEEAAIQAVKEEAKKQTEEKEAEAEKLEAEIEQIRQEKIEKEQAELAEAAAKQAAKEEAARIALEKALKAKEEMQPSFRKLVNYVKGLEGVNTIENDEKKQVRFLYGKKAFLVINDTPKDYRMQFMADPNKVVEWWNVNSDIRPRSNKKDNWFKLINKGSFTEELLFEIINNSHEFTIAELERAAEEKRLAKEQAKAEKNK